MTQQDVELIILVTLVILQLYHIFIKSYYQEKGKNLATKEDVEEITKKIESVKSDIGLISHKRISIATEQRNALLDLNTAYSAWLNFVLHANTYGDHTDPELFRQRQSEKVDDYFHDFLLAEAKFEVFWNHDRKFIRQAADLKIETIKLSNLLQVSLIEISFASALIKRAKEMPEEEVSKREQLESAYNEMTAYQEKYRRKSQGIYKPISKMHGSLISAIAERIMNE